MEYTRLFFPFYFGVLFVSILDCFSFLFFFLCVCVIFVSLDVECLSGNSKYTLMVIVLMYFSLSVTKR